MNNRVQKHYQSNIEKNLEMKLLNRQATGRKKLNINECQLLKWLNCQSFRITPF